MNSFVSPRKRIFSSRQRQEIGTPAQITSFVVNHVLWFSVRNIITITFYRLKKKTYQREFKPGN